MARITSPSGQHHETTKAARERVQPFFIDASCTKTMKMV